MTISAAYRAQVDLLLQILPHVAQEEAFALKGGTAINLFARDMPRLSADIDLTYLPFDDRETALASIAEALRRIQRRIESAIPGTRTNLVSQSGGQETKVVCQSTAAQIKIEVNTVIRGHILPPRRMDISEPVEAEFGKFVSISVVSHAELFGGKICAALDRQHPRDLFDIHHLLRNEGFTDDVRMGFLALLISHPRPIHEMLRPNFSDQRAAFGTQFSGMALTPFTYHDYETTRQRLVREIRERLTEDDRKFLLSFKRGHPEWGRVPLENLKRMPAVLWKLSNIQKLCHQNPEKHAEQLTALESRL